MSEQSIYFAIGCIVTALLALMFAPIFWRRALRLTRERLQLQVPLSMQEILAERDQLRAEFAVERLRVEQAMASIQTAHDRDMLEIGRLTAAAVAAQDQLQARMRIDESAQAEAARMVEDAKAREAENGTLRFALDAAEGRADLWQDRAERARDRHLELVDENEEQRTMIASLKTRAMGLEMRLTDNERSGDAGAARGAGLRAKLETAMEHAARHETVGISLRRELDEAKLQVRTLETELAEARKALDASRDREKVAQMQRSLTTDRSRPAEPGAAEKLELLASENEALRQALDVQRSAEAAGPQDDADVRESIRALGLAVARLSRQARETAPQDAQEHVLRETKEKHPLGVS